MSRTALRRSNAQATRSVGPIRRFLRKEKVAGYLFISPWIIGFLAFQLYPLVDTAYNSFTKLGLFGPPEWVGWQNYQQLFFQICRHLGNRLEHGVIA